MVTSKQVAIIDQRVEHVHPRWRRCVHGSLMAAFSYMNRNWKSGDPDALGKIDLHVTNHEATR